MNDNVTITDEPAIEYSRGYRQPFIDFRHGDGVAGMASIKTGTVKCVLVDPPYLYLKGQKLEREFDEFLYFSKVRRVLSNDGFIVMFGRGASFYRWNVFLQTLGFKFKEEFVWDKGNSSSPLMSISRVHETISVWTKKDGVLNKVKVPYLEMKANDIDSVIQDINRLKAALKNTKSLDAVAAYLENNQSINQTERKHNHSASVKPSKLMNEDRSAAVMKIITKGMNEKSIVRTDFYDSETFTKHAVTSDKRKDGDRCVKVVNSVVQGMNEKSIIESVRDHYTSIHPTQKPVPLLKRLINLTTKKGDVIIDNFAGSASSGEASAELERNWIGWEIDKEYYDLAINKRLKNTAVQVSMF